jgi:hypothetical protein
MRVSPHCKIGLCGGVQDEAGVGWLLEGAGVEAVGGSVVLWKEVRLGEGLHAHRCLGWVKEKCMQCN